MSFLRRRRKRRTASVGSSSPGKSTKKRKIFPAELKMLAVEALEAGLSPTEVSEIVGSGGSTVLNWRKL